MAALMDTFQRIEVLLGLLNRYDVAVSKCVGDGDQREEPQAIAIQRAFRFARDTLESVLLVLRERRDLLSALTLCRACYELGLRILWASREPSGWQRLQAYYARQDKKWASAVKGVPDYRRVGERILDLAGQVLDKNDTAEKRYGRMPGVCDILKAIEKRDLVEAQLPRANGAAAFEYNNVYRIMCRPAHGNVFSISDGYPVPTLQHLIVGAALATFAILRVACVLAAEDEGRETEAVEKKIIEVIDGSRELTLDARRE